MQVVLRFPGLRGILLLVSIVAAALMVPRWITPTPVASEVEGAVRALWGREILARWQPHRAGLAGDSALAVSNAMAADLVAIEQRRITKFDVRRGWIGPPLGRRWTYFVRTEEAGVVSYYRLNRGLAARASAIAWRLRLL